MLLFVLFTLKISFIKKIKIKTVLITPITILLKKQKIVNGHIALHEK